MSMNLATISIVNVLPTRPQRSLVFKEWSLSPERRKMFIIPLFGSSRNSSFASVQQVCTVVYIFDQVIFSQ